MTRIGWVRRTILSRQGIKPWAPLWALLGVLAPVPLRTALDPWVAGLPFLTFFPALLIATILLDWRWGTVVLAASALVGNYIFQPPRMAFALGPKEMVGTTGFVIFGALIVWAAEALRRSVVELEARTAREAALNLELQHRVNNILTVIQGLAQQTARNSSSIEGFYGAFSERLLAISEANKVLSRGVNISVLPDLVAAATRPFRGRGMMHVEGPACRLPGNACLPLALCLHELGTNAVKYGALSAPDGCVRLSWTLRDGACRIVWREEGGPAVAPPTRQGLGSRLLRKQTGLVDVRLEYAPAGVVCEILVEGAAPI